MKKRVVCFMLILALLSATVLSTTAFADSPYIGSTYEFNYSTYALNFTLKPYIYYTSNTSSSITIDHFEMFLNNKGTGPLLTFEFVAMNGSGNGNGGIAGGDRVDFDEEDLELYQGEMLYVTSGKWTTAAGVKSATYTKSPSSAIFTMGAGQYGYGAVDIWANTDKTFTCYTQGTAIYSLNSLDAEKAEISFTGFDTDFSTEYSVNNLRSADDLTYIETKAPKFIDSNGSECELALASLENGKASYLANVSEDDMVGATVVSPVIYMEQAIGTIEIPVNDDASDAVLDTVEIKASGKESESYVVVKFTANNSDFVPYDMVLVSDGTEYESTVSAYYFDSESGDFTRGCYIFRDLLIEDLGANVYLKADSALEKSVPEIVVY